MIQRYWTMKHGDLGNTNVVLNNTTLDLTNNDAMLNKKGELYPTKMKTYVRNCRDHVKDFLL